ncbi:hypothetical protein GGR71_000160 [Xanthomonas sp. F1]
MAEFDMTTRHVRRGQEGAGNGSHADLRRATEGTRGRAISAEENGI